ncbi:MAG TPA: hypothetical protein V6D23_28755, partial [Candidatus Obscuribacterales bacterium]
KLIPFEGYFPPGKANRHLPKQLEAELEGILAWAVRGFLDYLEHGLLEPDEVKIAVQRYRDEQDSLRVFLDTEVLPRLEPGEGKRARDLHSEYLTWAELNDAPRLSEKALASRLEKLGWESKRTSFGMVKYPPRKSCIADMQAGNADDRPLTA